MGGLRRSRSLWKGCVCVYVCGLWLLTIPPINNLEPCCNKKTKKKRKKTTLSGPHNARGPDDVICHLQLMKVMMTCMGAAYVHHLLGSTTLELLPTKLRRGVEARLYQGTGVPRRVWKTAACIPMTRRQFNHAFTPQAAKVTGLWGHLFYTAWAARASRVMWQSVVTRKKNNHMSNISCWCWCSKLCVHFHGWFYLHSVHYNRFHLV